MLGYLLTQLDRREKITGEIEALIKRRFGELVFDTTIRINTHHKASPSHRKTIYQYEGKSGKGRQDYDGLTDEVLARLGEALHLDLPAESAPSVEIAPSN